VRSGARSRPSVRLHSQGNTRQYETSGFVLVVVNLRMQGQGNELVVEKLDPCSERRLKKGRIGDPKPLLETPTANAAVHREAVALGS